MDSACDVNSKRENRVRNIEELKMNITEINNDNLAAFSPFLTEEIKKAILDGPDVVAFGAYDDEEDNVALGVIVGDAGEYSMRIRYLYVEESRRREGIGTYLLDWLSQYCLMYEIEMFTAEYPDSEEYADIEDFFNDGGFSKEENPVREYSMRIGDVRKLKMFSDIDSFKPGPQIQSFSQMRRAVLNSFSGERFRRGDTCLYELLSEKLIDEDMSFAYVEDNSILAVMAASVDGNDVTVEWAYSDPQKYAVLLPTIKAFAANISPKVGNDAVMHIMGMTEAADGLIEGLFKDSISETVKWTTRMLDF